MPLIRGCNFYALKSPFKTKIKKIVFSQNCSDFLILKAKSSANLDLTRSQQRASEEEKVRTCTSKRNFDKFQSEQIRFIGFRQKVCLLHDNVLHELNGIIVKLND